MGWPGAVRPAKRGGRGAVELLDAKKPHTFHLAFRTLALGTLSLATQPPCSEKPKPQAEGIRRPCCLPPSSVAGQQPDSTSGQALHSHPG